MSQVKEREIYKNNGYGGKKKRLICVWDQFDESSNKEKEHAYVVFMASTSFDVGLDDTIYDDNDEDKTSLGIKLKHQSWYMDNRCSQHMIKEMQMFQSHEMKEWNNVGFGRNQKGMIK